MQRDLSRKITMNELLNMVKKTRVILGYKERNL